MTREEALKILNTLLFFEKVDCTKEEAKECLKVAIKALEQEPRKGHWVAHNDDCNDWYECSECGYGSEGEMQFNSEHDVRTNYCPYCGADMRGIKE